MKQPEPGSLWKHYKGGVYKVHFVAMHSDDKSPMVIYKNIEHDSDWARPLKEWYDMIGETPRFRDITNH